MSPETAHLLLKFSLAVLFGGSIGFERELNGKFAGLRTHALICLGAALIMDMSISLSMSGGTLVGDPTRLGAQIVTGIGFLGAGSILQAKGRITGLTTAATIWVVAAVGIGLGADKLLESAIATAFIWAILVFPAQWQRIIRRARRNRVGKWFISDESWLASWHDRHDKDNPAETVPEDEGPYEGPKRLI